MRQQTPSPHSIFPRQDLADKIVSNLLKAGPTSAIKSGLFLSAPRRTGKSTFLREDLRPALETAGAHVLYVDLWADKQSDPGELIVAAIRQALSAHEGVMLRLARATGLERLNVAGNSFSLDRVGLGKDVTLTQALAHLSDELRKPIVLIIDEAQHALTSPNGSDALFALKAARDELNSSKHSGLFIVATGSNRDKLALLRNSKDQAFFMAAIAAVPHLGADYIRWFCEHADLQAPLQPESVDALFAQTGHRPELLYAAADEVRLDFTCQPHEVPQRFAQAIGSQIKAMEQESLRIVQSLSPLQRAVLSVMAAYGANYAPYDSQTIDAYNQVLAKRNAPTNADVPNAQTALAALQACGLIWRESRGVYALEDTSLASIMENHGLLDHVPPLAQQDDTQRPGGG